MVKDIEKQIRDLQKEAAELQKERSIIVLQPCRGDREIRQKDEKIAQFDKRTLLVERTIRELEKKRREIMSEGTKRGIYESPY